jgi:surface protein
MNEIFVYPEDFIFPEDRSITTGAPSTDDLSSTEPQLDHISQSTSDSLLLPEEPPLVPPSLFSDDSEAGIDFRSSFLFQSSCYLPDDDDSDSDASPRQEKENKPQNHHDEPMGRQPQLGSQERTGSLSSDDNVAMRSSARKSFDRKLKSWKDPRHHHIEFRNDVSVSDVTRKVDPSWRGYKIYVPGQQGETETTDERDNFTVTAAGTRAGMSTLSYEVADFFTFVFPTTRRHRWTCATILVVLLAASAIVSVTCGMGYCRIRREAPKPIAAPAEPPTNAPTNAPSVLDAVPTSSPMSQIVTAGTKSFQSTDELYRAVDDYLLDGSQSSLVSLEYGYPIGLWDVRQISNLSNVFDARRNPLAEEFNQDLNAWDISNVSTLEGMFFGATAFDANISSWNTSNVKSMREFMTRASSFNGDISQWDVSSVETMESMCTFEFTCHNELYVRHLTSVLFAVEYAQGFNANLLGWNTSSVVTMANMFSDCLSFEGRGLESWDTSNVESLMFSFMNTPKFKGDLSAWDISRVVSLKGTFRQSVSFNSDLSDWNLENVKDMSETVRSIGLCVV